CSKVHGRIFITPNCRNPVLSVTSLVYRLLTHIGSASLSRTHCAIMCIRTVSVFIRAGCVSSTTVKSAASVGYGFRRHEPQSCQLPSAQLSVEHLIGDALFVSVPTARLSQVPQSRRFAQNL